MNTAMSALQEKLATLKTKVEEREEHLTGEKIQLASLEEKEKRGPQNH